MPHKKLLQEVSQKGVRGGLLDVLYDYLEDRKQFVRADNTSSKVLSITSGVPQGSLLGPLLFCIFINDLPNVLRFSEPNLFADDFKILAIGHSQSDVQIDMDAIDSWIRTNHMELAIDKCSMLKNRGTEKEFHLAGKPLKTDSEVRDLAITVGKNFSWTAHINNRLKKANRVFYGIRRNAAFKVNTFIKLGLYKSLILPILLYGLDCLTVVKYEHQSLQKLQRKAVKWIKGQYEDYTNQLRLLNILPLPMYLQLDNLPTPSKLVKENSEHFDLPEINEQRGRKTELFNLEKRRIEKPELNLFI